MGIFAFFTYIHCCRWDANYIFVDDVITKGLSGISNIAYGNSELQCAHFSIKCNVNSAAAGIITTLIWAPQRVFLRLFYFILFGSSVGS